VIEAALAAVAEVVDARVEAWSAATPASSAVAVEATPAARPATGASGRDAAGPRIESLSQTVRIDVDKLDELINLVGELVVDRTRFAQVSRSLASRYKEDEQVRALGETSIHVSKVIDALHERMMQVRMLPIGVLFSKFPRLVRDLARSMEKDVTLVVEGEDTEIDRSVIEEIKDPLVHLIRNAVDHGVESTEQRAAAGKPAHATVRLVAQHGQGHIVISLSDDGAGISPERIRQAAVDKGLITAETAQRLSDAEAIDLIFAAGFSTAAKTTEVSGRGVGMDIVRSKIESLNGSVEVESQAGQGTTFRLRLPLTLATVRGLLVSINDGTYAIPLAYVREIVRPEATSASGVLGRKAIQLRDDAMPLFDLGDVLRRNGVPGGPAPRAERDDAYVVVVRASESEADRPVALLVDAVLDQQEIVVKSMSAAAGRARGIAGATILGDGEVALILDIPTLVKAAQAASSGVGVQASRAPERSAA
jgi:two-component system chemotaxis sensor kinase CheA